MNISEKLQKGFGVKNFVEFCIEFFPPPLPLVLPDGQFGGNIDSNEKINEGNELFLNSRQFGFEPIFLTENISQSITIAQADEASSYEVVDGTEVEISARDFIKFQLLKIDVNTFFQIASRVDYSIENDLVLKLLKESLDPSIEVDEFNFPKDQKDWPYWLDVHQNSGFFNPHKPDEKFEKKYPGSIKEWEKNKSTSTKFIKEFRESHRDKILDPLVDMLFDKNCGFNTWLETNIYDNCKKKNLSTYSKAYSKWDCPLMIIYRGNFWPVYYEEGDPTMWNPGKSSILNAFVRNYDEGTKKK